jgi:hypothetical protein
MPEFEQGGFEKTQGEFEKIVPTGPLQRIIPSGPVRRLGSAKDPAPPRRAKLKSSEAERILQAAIRIAGNGGGLRELVAGNIDGKAAMKAVRLRLLLNVVLEARRQPPAD